MTDNHRASSVRSVVMSDERSTQQERKDVDTDMSRELVMPKASPHDVAVAVLDGIEAGQEDIFPDPFAVEFGRQFGSSPRDAERQMAAMTPAMTSDSAA